jgi:phage tail-like protein
MPNLIGMQYGKAKLILDNAGLVCEYVVYDESYEARNTVLAQMPQRGQMIYAGDRVALAISRDSYVRWLPAIYQRSDLSGRNYVKELLWITQHLFGSLEQTLDIGHTFYDPYESPDRFLPWLASWTAMILEEDWPIAKKRRLIKRAVELYRIRGTLRGLKLFISLFTGYEPDVRENEWPFKGWRIGVTSSMGIDTVVLPPVNLSHTFIVEMPTAYRDLSPESVIRLHEIVLMEKPAHTQYYLRFAAEARDAELREFYVIGARSGIGIGQEIIRRGASEDAPPMAPVTIETQTSGRTTQLMAPVAPEVEFPTGTRQRRALPKAPRADNAPIEGREVRSSEEGFGKSARAMEALVGESSKVGPQPGQPTVPGKAIAQPGAPTIEEPMQPMDAGDTDENVLGNPGETVVSGKSKKLAEQMKQAKKLDSDEDPDPPTSIRTKKPDPKKSK